jgi:hypothetical protein
MGRIPKLVKERALREQKEEQMRQEAALTEPNERYMQENHHAHHYLIVVLKIMIQMPWKLVRKIKIDFLT